MAVGGLGAVGRRTVGATGVPRKARAKLLHQLLRDLATAREAGAQIVELVATPPEVFADSCTAGMEAPPSRPIGIGALLLVCLGAGVVGAGAAWLLLLVSWVPAVVPFGLDEGQFYLFVDLFLVAAVLGLMVVAVRLVFRRHADSAALAPRLATTLVGGTLVGFPLASVYGASHAYHVNPEVVGVECVIVLAFLALAVILARKWTMLTRGPDIPRVGTAA
jgi:hypothetical protein